jgi:hypothetical protein
MGRIHQLEGDREGLLLDLDEIARAGASKMLAQALEAEVEDYLQAAKGERDEQGHALVVRNGYAREREVLLGAGDRWKSGHRGSTTEGWTTMAREGASRA